MLNFAAAFVCRRFFYDNRVFENRWHLTRKNIHYSHVTSSLRFTHIPTPPYSWRNNIPYVILLLFSDTGALMFREQRRLVDVFLLVAPDS